MDDAISAAVSERTSAIDARTVQLRDTVRASELACRAAAEVVRNARNAIAASEQLMRSARLALQALECTWAHRAQLRTELNGGGDQSSAVATTDPR